MVALLVHVDRVVLGRARAKAKTEEKTLAEVVTDLLAAYAGEDKPEPKPRARRK